MKGVQEGNYEEHLFEKVANIPGTGAAGGAVAAMIALFGNKARTVPGMDFVADLM